MSEQAKMILTIPLVNNYYSNALIWIGENTTEYLVKSGYKWCIAGVQDETRNDNNLQDIATKNYYTKQWNLKIPNKIRIHL